ncbi:MAG: PTS sugar transporter subunit IIA [bacterium]
MKELLKGHIYLDIKGDTKDEILKEIVFKVKELGNEGMKKKVLSLIKERESASSTGLGFGVAIPHIRSELVENILIYAFRAKKEIEYNSIDGYPVRLLFLVLIPQRFNKSASIILSSIVDTLRSEELRKKLLLAKNEKEFLNIIVDKRFEV